MYVVELLRYLFSQAMGDGDGVCLLLLCISYSNFFNLLFLHEHIISTVGIDASFYLLVWQNREKGRKNGLEKYSYMCTVSYR